MALASSSKKLYKLVFTVTNDLNYDQRMIRICTSLTDAGFNVLLVGRLKPDSPPLTDRPFYQKRLRPFFQKGKFFYLEFNMRLFFYLLFRKASVICAIDLDTILPCLFVSKLKRIKRVYDAHELFCEMKEVVTRPGIQKIWKGIERFAVPAFTLGYTVNKPIAEKFREMYGSDFLVIRNLPVPFVLQQGPIKEEKFIIYQGAVNEGRSFETLIPAMKFVGARLIIYGNGNFARQAKKLTIQNQLEGKVVFKGSYSPDELKNRTSEAWAGVTLFENVGLSNYYSLANRFFDYIQAGIPQVCVNYPAYREINEQYKVALLIEKLDEGTIARALNQLLNDHDLYEELKQNCIRARVDLNWKSEEKKLVEFYQRIVPLS